MPFSIPYIRSHFNSIIPLFYFTTKSPKSLEKFTINTQIVNFIINIDKQIRFVLIKSRGKKYEQKGIKESNSRAH